MQRAREINDRDSSCCYRWPTRSSVVYILQTRELSLEGCACVNYPRASFQVVV